MAHGKNQDFLSNEERLTDIDMAMLLIGLMDDPPDFFPKPQMEPFYDGSGSFKTVKGILRTFTNPLAKELVMERITGE